MSDLVELRSIMAGAKTAIESKGYDRVSAKIEIEDDLCCVLAYHHPDKRCWDMDHEYVRADGISELRLAVYTFTSNLRNVDEERLVKINESLARAKELAEKAALDLPDLEAARAAFAAALDTVMKSTKLEDRR